MMSVMSSMNSCCWTMTENPQSLVAAGQQCSTTKQGLWDCSVSRRTTKMTNAFA